MISHKVEIELAGDQELLLMNRYGRKCSRETLIQRALDEVAPLPKIKRKPKEPKPANPQPRLLPGSGDSEDSEDSDG